MHDRLKDLTEVWSAAFSESFKKINKVYIAFIFIFIRSLFESYRFRELFGLVRLEGLIVYFIDIILLCFVAQSLRSVVLYGNPGKKSISSAVGNFIGPCLNTLFFIYLIQMLIRLFAKANFFSLYTILVIAFEFFMSAVIEEIYINDKSGYEAIRASAKFTCDNFLTYGIFCLIFILIEVYIHYNINFAAAFGLRKTGLVILIAIIQMFYYLIRGHLFKYLNNHPYRQRKFMRQ